MFTHNTIYDDSDAHQMAYIPPTQPHREVDLENVHADAEGEFGALSQNFSHFMHHLWMKGYVRVYIILPSTIYGLATGRLVDLGIQNPHSIQVPMLIKASIDRGRAGVVGEGKNLWPDVNIEDGMFRITIPYTLRSRLYQLQTSTLPCSMRSAPTPPQDMVAMGIISARMESTPCMKLAGPSEKPLWNVEKEPTRNQQVSRTMSSRSILA
jgi:hypothetical protein